MQACFKIRVCVYKMFYELLPFIVYVGTYLHESDCNFLLTFFKLDIARTIAFINFVKCFENNNYFLCCVRTGRQIRASMSKVILLPKY
jgi:hypothetical protein